ncbi:MAG TPA: YhjD/YihY/BrkB family envelope integrity protein, partial [Treponemataceae bacterium]|nr:YhjD/YihY/BrkB family envelope integrity protein [Treponemataceae bacterium]HQF74423.1 YhjD/YihY/BrkB family envelope integrity protein [Treponemataceae bacterium]
MHRKRNVFLVSLQRLYITWESFVGNDLFTFASAGAYSFLLSALPIVLMVLLILVRVLHTSPEAIQTLISENGFETATGTLSKYIEPMLAFRTVGIFEMIIGITVFWMARRFFASIQRGMRMIYRKQGKKKPIKENLIVIAAEVVLVILIVLMTIFLIAGNAFFNTVLSANLLSPVLFRLFRNLFRFVPFGIIFVFLFLV